MGPIFPQCSHPLPTVPASPNLLEVPDKPVFFAHLYVGLADIAIGRIGDVLPDPTGEYLVPQVEAPGKQVRVREGNPENTHAQAAGSRNVGCPLTLEVQLLPSCPSHWAETHMSDCLTFQGWLASCHSPSGASPTGAGHPAEFSALGCYLGERGRRTVRHQEHGEVSEGSLMCRLA